MMEIDNLVRKSTMSADNEWTGSQVKRHGTRRLRLGESITDSLMPDTQSRGKSPSTTTGTVTGSVSSSLPD